MMNVEDYASSDSSDDEYVPSDGEAVSEEEGSGEEEDLQALVKDGEDNSTKVKGKGKKRKAKPDSCNRKRRGGIQLEGETETVQKEEDTYNKDLVEVVKKEQEQKKVEEEKKKSDSLWADFMKDVGGPKAKPKQTSSLGSLSRPISTHSKTASTSSSFNTAKSPSTSSGSNGKIDGKSQEKVKITTQYDFAGETVTVTKEVDANSKEAKKEFHKTTDVKEAGPVIPSMKKPGGLGSVLGKIGNKPKMGTLLKSKLDWDSFKKAEGIEEELQIHNRGKEGYVERQQFLQRTDVRQFEIEKSIRLSNSKRGFLSTD